MCLFFFFVVQAFFFFFFLPPSRSPVMQTLAFSKSSSRDLTMAPWHTSLEPMLSWRISSMEVNSLTSRTVWVPSRLCKKICISGYKQFNIQLIPILSSNRQMVIGIKNISFHPESQQKYSQNVLEQAAKVLNPQVRFLDDKITKINIYNIEIMKQQQNYMQNSMNTTFSMMPGSKTIGNYIISKNLGEGTFGKVKLGIHSQTQEKVAIKILEKSKISDVADVERVTREINILKQVRHPNIIQLYEIIETPKQLFLVMEYVSEGELFDQIVRMKRLKENEACEYFQQIIAGVEYLHELGVVHRDLKPQNLLIDFNRRIKLVDFGLSNTYKQRELLKTACGSPCYAAPQMIAGKKYEGLMADVWSCGVILYAMVCGYLPFEDPNTSALYKKIIAGEFKIPKFVSASAKQLIKGILTTDPQRRMTLKQIKQHEWFKEIHNNQFYNHERPPCGIKVSSHLIPIDPTIVQELTEFDESSAEEIAKYVANNRHNHTVTAYYLLLKKNLKLGVYSSSDICSPIFDRNLLISKVETAHASVNSSFTATSKNVKADKNDDASRTIDEIDLGRNTNTSNGFRIGSRAINRLNIRQFANSSKNNYIGKKKQDSLELKIEFDNLPIVDNMTKVSQKRRRLNINTHRNKRQELSDLYGVEDVFRATAYIPRQSVQKNTIAVTNRTPLSFRTSLDRYQQQSRQNDDRYQSLEINQIDPESIPKQKQLMNKTFMGRIPKNSIPKWSDESERIRSILNKTITGHGTRKKKSQQLSFS